MSADLKAGTTTGTPPIRREKGVRIFPYPKIIFIFPTLVVAIVCWIGMMVNGDKTDRPSLQNPEARRAQEKAEVKDKLPIYTPDFKSTQNLLAFLFLGTFALNILILAFDFPRFTVVAGILIGTTIIFFLLWLSLLTNWWEPLMRLLDGLYMAANSGFYMVFSIVLLVIYGIIFLTRWLNYWEFLPNEILHHHGPWSDLERFPTMNLKFDKEIPDIFEHVMLGAGRLVFHVAGEQKSIVLENVLYINRKEQALKQIMSRMEVRVTTDQESAGH